METLKQIKEGLYNDISNRHLDFLSDEEEYILDNLESKENKNGVIFKYKKDEAVNIVLQALNSYTMNSNEHTIREAGYVTGYEVALKDILNDLTSIVMFDEIKSDKDIENRINYLLNN